VIRSDTSPASKRRGRPARAGVRGLAVVTLLLAPIALAAPASAHVTVTPSTTEAGAPALVTVSIGHGCEGSSTTAVQIRIPDSVYSVTPTRNPLWEVSVEKEPVVPPVTDAHGTQITDRVASVTYRTDNPLPDGQRDTFELALRLPADVGKALVFATIQTCEKGESAWIEVPAAGQNAEDLELPAPAFVLTAPGTTSPAGAPSDEVALVARNREPEAGSSLLALGALGVAVAGVLVGLAALKRQRPRS
jgi:uncharacterized protein YcnI